MLKCHLTHISDQLVFVAVEHARLIDLPDAPVDAEESDRIKGSLRHALKVLTDNAILNAESRRAFAITITRLAGQEYTNKSLAMQLCDLYWIMIRRLDQVNFALIKEEAVGYFEQEALFGEKVRDLFQEAGDDIKAAGNCLAADLNTAAVYHLMRVAELGLRRIARRLRVTLIDKKKPCQIEYAVWDKVITACKNRIEKARAGNMGPRKEKELHLYADAADHCVFMKDIWRNNLSHTRHPYSRTEAIAALERVRGFMQFLAEFLR